MDGRTEVVLKLTKIESRLANIYILIFFFTNWHSYNINVHSEHVLCLPWLLNLMLFLPFLSLPDTQSWGMQGTQSHSLLFRHVSISVQTIRLA